MVDKMMRMSGRSTKGKAKAIETDDQGRITVNPSPNEIGIDIIKEWQVLNVDVNNKGNDVYELKSSGPNSSARVTYDESTNIPLIQKRSDTLEYGVYVAKLVNQTERDPYFRVSFFDSDNTLIGTHRNDYIQEEGRKTTKLQIPRDAVSVQIRLYNNDSDNVGSIAIEVKGFYLKEHNEKLGERKLNFKDIALNNDSWSEWLTFEETQSVITFYGRIEGFNGNIEIELEDMINDPAYGSGIKVRSLSVIVHGGRFITDVIQLFSESTRVRFKIEGVNTNITHLFIKPINTVVKSSGGGGSLSVQDLNGNPVDLTAELDRDNRAVLRTVDAAPRAYDEETNVLRVVDFSSELLGNTEYVNTINDVEVSNSYELVPYSTEINKRFTHFSIVLNVDSPDFKIEVSFGGSDSGANNRRRRFSFNAESLKTIDSLIQPDTIESNAYFLPKIPFLGTMLEVSIINTGSTNINIGEAQIMYHKEG